MRRASAADDSDDTDEVETEEERETTEEEDEEGEDNDEEEGQDDEEDRRGNGTGKRSLGDRAPAVRKTFLLLFSWALVLGQSCAVVSPRCVSPKRRFLLVCWAVEASWRAAIGGGAAGAVFAQFSSCAMLTCRRIRRKGVNRCLLCRPSRPRAAPCYGLPPCSYSALLPPPAQTRTALPHRVTRSDAAAVRGNLNGEVEAPDDRTGVTAPATHIHRRREGGAR